MEIGIQIAVRSWSIIELGRIHHQTGIQQVLFVRCVPDASFTHSQIENLSVEEINQMHFNSVVGQVLDTYNEYDHERPNLVIRVSFDLHSSSGMFDIASLIVYARDMDDNTIPLAVLSVGDNRVISIDTTSVPRRF